MLVANSALIAVRADEEMLARVFNAGSDARLAGLPLTANPYTRSCGWQWAEGWRHVDRYWGKDARAHGRWRWPVPALPVVAEADTLV